MPSFAAEIDLSDFAGGDSATHSHTWESKYDEEYHWQECSLCGLEQNKSEHSLSTSYTLGVETCKSGNYKISSCSTCSFNTSVRPMEHSPSGEYIMSFAMNPIYPVGNYYVYNKCAVCLDQYTPAYSVQDVDGNAIDWRQVFLDDLPLDIYYNGQKLYTVSTFHYSDQGISVDYTMTIDKSSDTCTIDATFDYSNSVYQEKIDASIENVAVELVRMGTGLGTTRTRCTVVSADTDTNTVSAIGTCYLRDSTADWLYSFNVYPAILCDIYEEGMYTGRVSNVQASSSDSNKVLSNFIDPTISEVISR